MHRFRWIALIVGLLLFSVGTQAILIVSALSSPSFAVVPDYENKARNWDDVARQRALNERLAFTIDAEVAALPAPGEAFVEVRLWDTWGKPLREATLNAEAFQLSRAQHPLRLKFHHVQDNLYRAQATLAPPGLWQFDWVVERGADRYTESSRIEVAR